MGTCIEDVARLLNVMASVGYDERDNVTALRPPEMNGRDYTTLLNQGSSRDVRLGLVEGLFNKTSSDETTPVNNAMDQFVSQLKNSGATIVPINEGVYNSSAISSNLDVQRFECREGLTGYLQRPETHDSHPATMPELYSTDEFLVIPSQYEYVNTALKSSTSNSSYDGKIRGIQDLKVALAETFARNNLDALIYPEQANLVVKLGSPSQSGRNGILGALVGSPVVTVPIGHSPSNPDAPRGIPIGMEILGRPFTEDKLLQIGAMIERITPPRLVPELAEQSVQTCYHQDIPPTRPLKNIPSEYTVGTLQ